MTTRHWVELLVGVGVAGPVLAAGLIWGTIRIIRPTRRRPARGEQTDA